MSKRADRYSSPIDASCDRAEQDADPGTEVLLTSLPFSLILAFAEIAEIPLRICKDDGRILPEVLSVSENKICAILSARDAYPDTCARHHASAAATAIQLRRPYIFNCHAGLAEWVIPILYDNEPLPAVMLCGGVLFSDPDAALIRQAEAVADKHNIERSTLVKSLDSIPVRSRKKLRQIADYLFQLSEALPAYEMEPGTAQDMPATPSSLAEVTLVLPAKRKKRLRKSQTVALERESMEAEIIRLLGERKSDAALSILTELLQGLNFAGKGIAAELEVAETFTRLFRRLTLNIPTSRGIYHKHAHLVSEILTPRTHADPHDFLAKVSRKFVLIIEELTGEPRPRQVRAIQRFIDKNLGTKLTLKSVGCKFGLKDKALDALIRKHCGMGFIDYITSARISEAKRLLRSSDLPIGEVAHKSGFKDQSYFTKVFKSRIGITPTEFRERENNV